MSLKAASDLDSDSHFIAYDETKKNLIIALKSN